MIRPYRPEDRPSIEDICAQTGAKGQPITQMFSDGELFAKLITSYFLDNEPSGAFVAEDKSSQGVVGYCITAVDGKKADNTLMPELKRQKWSVLKRVIMDYSMTDLAFLARCGLSMGDFGKRKSCEGATLHFNVREDHRQGVGLDLLARAELYLREQGVRQCYGHVFQIQKDPTVPVQGALGERTNLRHADRLYPKGGFQVVDSVELPWLRAPSGQSVYTTTILKRLDSPSLSTTF